MSEQAMECALRRMPRRRACVKVVTALVFATGLAVHAPPAPRTCVPYASDVDCIGGSGNGPAYTGPVRVIGPDVYDLDRDWDGFGCE